jgi:hypothetical protein
MTTGLIKWLMSYTIVLESCIRRSRLNRAGAPIAADWHPMTSFSGQVSPLGSSPFGGQFAFAQTRKRLISGYFYAIERLWAHGTMIAFSSKDNCSARVSRLQTSIQSKSHQERDHEQSTFLGISLGDRPTIATGHYSLHALWPSWLGMSSWRFDTHIPGVFTYRE